VVTVNDVLDMTRAGLTGQPTELDDAWFRAMAEASGDVFFVVRLSPDVALEFVSENAVDQLGRPAADLLANPDMFAHCVHPEDATALAEFLAWPPGRQGFQELRWLHPDGTVTWARAWIRSRERADGSVALEGTSHDISELRAAEQLRMLFEDRYRLMAESANIVLWTMGLDGSITYVSPTVEQMRGFTPEEAMNQTLDEILTPESQASVAEYYALLYAEMAAGRVPNAFRCEQEYLCKDGSTIWTELEVIPYLGPDGTITEILGITRDISDRKRSLDELKESRDELAVANGALVEANEHLNRLAVTDSLTGAWNRRRGEQILASDAAKARRYEVPTSLLLIDIDHFKRVNDTHGHQVGDGVLIELTTRLRMNLRTTDELVRWGGDEFIVLTQHCTEEEAAVLGEKIRVMIDESPFNEAGHVTVSVGVAAVGVDDNVTAWLSRADGALYDAKDAGRNTVRTAG
jgi:diguanylate cyclase (GGDEF)-like protein/PAS domain S-box-containing protein